ncbi:MAG: endonuclease/exonuclease/phosphatase family protein [Gemmatimonadota bacterium]|jgi:endonuclease/exonuclease/phosphatase family metal-dependent hydrolase
MADLDLLRTTVPGRLVALTSLLLACAFPPPVRAQDTLTVAAYNIKHGRGLDGRVDLERVAAVLHGIGADVVALQEVDRGTERTDRVDQPDVLARLTETRASFGAHRPYQGGEYGNAILSRLPVLRRATRPLAPAAGSALTVHEVVVGVGDPERPVSFVSVHLAGSPRDRLLQADSLTAHFAGVGHPVVLAGDFNSRPGDPVMDRLREAWTVVPKDGPAETFPADAPDREIDYVLFRPASAFEIVEHRVIEEAAASDHRPIRAVLRVLR